MEHHVLHVWGFSAEDLRAWPEDLEPLSVDPTSWPDQAPVVVHGNVWEAFQQWTNAGKTEVDAVLYLPSDMEEPEGAWAYFDEIISAEQESLWDVFRDLAEFPQQYQLKAWADAVPNELLDKLHRPDYQLDYQALPLPAPILALLHDVNYQDTYREALFERYRMRRAALGFSEDQLEDYVRGNIDDENRQAVEVFLNSSPLGRTSLDVLREELAEPIWEIALPSTSEATTDEISDLLSNLLNVLLFIAYISSLRRRWMQRRDPTHQPKEDFEDLLKTVHGGENVLIEGNKLEGYDFQCGITYNASAEALELYDVVGDGHQRKYVFWIELRTSLEAVESVRSIGGRATLPLSMIRAAHVQGAEWLAVTAA